MVLETTGPKGTIQREPNWWIQVHFDIFYGSVSETIVVLQHFSQKIVVCVMR